MRYFCVYFRYLAYKPEIIIAAQLIYLFILKKNYVS